MPYINERDHCGNLIREDGTEHVLSEARRSESDERLKGLKTLAKSLDGGVFSSSLQAKIKHAARQKRNNPLKLTTAQNVRKTKLNAQARISNQAQNSKRADPKFATTRTYDNSPRDSTI